MDENECKAFELEWLLRKHYQTGHHSKQFISETLDLIHYLRENSHTYREPLHRRSKT